MSKKVQNLEEALKILNILKIDWVTTNKIRNSMWDTGVAFFGKDYHRVAYYDETQNLLSIH